MYQLLALVAAMLLVATPVAAQTTPPTARIMQIDAARYPEVTLHVSVTNAAGQPVGGLTARDVRITEDGQAVEISSFLGGGVPMAAMLVIDRSGSMDEANKIDGARRAALAFIEQLRASDSAALIAFDTQPELLQGFTREQRALSRAVHQLEPNGATALYDSIITGVDVLQTIEGRRALIVMTDGQDRISADRDLQASVHSLDEAIAYANSHNVAVQVIGLGQRNTRDARAGIDETVLRRIADETDGQYFYAPDAEMLADLYRSLATTIQQEYQITYRSPRPSFDGTRRNIQVLLGSAPAIESRYVEPHLINVRSTPAVALPLLLVVAGLLFAPVLLRRRPKNDAVPPTAANVATMAQPVAARTQSEPAAGGTRFCDQCGASLRVAAHFCSRCGSEVATLAEGNKP